MEATKEKPVTEEAVAEKAITKEPLAEKEAGKSSSPDRRRVFMGDPKRVLGPQTALENQYDKMEVRQSPLEGFGVFATEKILANTVLEETPVVVWPRIDRCSEGFYRVMKDENFVSKDEINHDKIRTMFGFKHPMKYYFKWFPPNTPRTGPDVTAFQCLPLGYGPIYNSANGLNNAMWEVKEKTFVFKSIRDIEPGEEIQTFYGYMVAEDSTTWPVTDVFGFGLEYVAMEDGSLKVFMRNMRFDNEEQKQTRYKEEAWQKLAQALQKSQGLVTLLRISVLDGDEEKHPFDFPDNFPLNFAFRKLQEFKQTRFKIIKLQYSYREVGSDKEHKETTTFVNYNS